MRVQEAKLCIFCQGHTSELIQAIFLKIYQVVVQYNRVLQSGRVWYHLHACALRYDSAKMAHLTSLLDVFPPMFHPT